MREPSVAGQVANRHPRFLVIVSSNFLYTLNLLRCAIGFKRLKMRKELIFPLISITSFLIGGCIYMTMRDTSLLMFSWLFGEQLPNWLITIRESICVQSLPQWAYYSMPDGLWLLSYLLLIEYIWREDNSILKNLFLYSLPILAIINEIAQWFQLTNGTGDWNDIVCYLSSLSIFIICKNFICHEEKN